MEKRKQTRKSKIIKIKNRSSQEGLKEKQKLKKRKKDENMRIYETKGSKFLGKAL